MLKKIVAKVFGDGSGDSSSTANTPNLNAVSSQNEDSVNQETIETQVDNSIASGGSTSESPVSLATGSPAEHSYYEVGNDLLAKPNALTDVLESFGTPSTIVFCNSPSEADMVEVMLTKRGVSSEKLIGHVPYQKVAACVQKTISGANSVLIVTDIAAKDIEVAQFGLVVNYSIHEDPEIYIHRTTGTEVIGPRYGIVSLVSPLDFSNFHYLRKISGIAIAKRELPSKDAIATARLQSFLSDAVTTGKEKAESIKMYLDAILVHPEKESIFAFLVHNTVAVIPELKAASERGVRGGRDRRDDRRGSDERGDRNEARGGRGRGGDDRDVSDRDSRPSRSDRGGRGSDRDSDRRGSRGEDSRRGSSNRGRDERGRSEFVDEVGEERGSDTDRSESQRRERREYTPAEKDTRLYLGLGRSHGFSEAVLVDLLSEQTNYESTVIKRFSSRGRYSFVDVSGDIAPEIITALNGQTIGDGKHSLVVQRATIIPAFRENSGTRDDEGDGDSRNSSDDSDYSESSYSYSEDSEPNVVSFDE